MRDETNTARSLRRKTGKAQNNIKEEENKFLAIHLAESRFIVFKDYQDKKCLKDTIWLQFARKQIQSFRKS